MYLSQFVDLNVLWCHEEDGGQRANIHLGYGYSEDRQPGKHIGQEVDHNQDRVTKDQPKISADATLQRRTIIIKNICLWKLKLPQVIEVICNFSPSGLKFF